MRTDPAHFGYTGTLPREFVDFARRQLVNATLHQGFDRRREDRNPMMLPALAVGVDEDEQPIGECFEAITRDVSSTAIGLLHMEQIYYQRLAIHMSLADMDVYLLIALQWKKPMGPFYGSAGKYVKKLTQFPCPTPPQDRATGSPYLSDGLLARVDDRSSELCCG